MQRNRWVTTTLGTLLLAGMLGTTSCSAPNDSTPQQDSAATQPSQFTGSSTPGGSDTEPTPSDYPALPAPSGNEPPNGGNHLADSLPTWNPALENPETTMAGIAAQRQWPRHSEPGEGDSPTYLTDTDTAVNIVWVDNDTDSTVNDLAADAHMPFYHGGSISDLTQTSTGYLDRGYHFPGRTGSWISWKTKWALTPGRIRSFRYRIETGTAPAFQVGVQQNKQALLARYTPDPAQPFVTIPLTLDSTDNNWVMYDHTGKQLADQLTWSDVLSWPTPTGWIGDTFADQPIDPPSLPMPDGNNDVTFIPGDRNSVSLINTSDSPTHLSVLEFGFYWADMGRDYLQVRLFPKN